MCDVSPELLSGIIPIRMARMHLPSEDTEKHNGHGWGQGGMEGVPLVKSSSGSCY